MKRKRLKKEREEIKELLPPLVVLLPSLPPPNASSSPSTRCRHGYSRAVCVVHICVYWVLGLREGF